MRAGRFSRQKMRYRAISQRLPTIFRLSGEQATNNFSTVRATAAVGPVHVQCKPFPGGMFSECDPHIVDRVPRIGTDLETKFSSHSGELGGAGTGPSRFGPCSTVDSPLGEWRVSPGWNPRLPAPATAADGDGQANEPSNTCQQNCTRLRHSRVLNRPNALTGLTDIRNLHYVIRNVGEGGRQRHRFRGDCRE